MIVLLNLGFLILRLTVLAYNLIILFADYIFHLHLVSHHTILVRTMLLLKELPTSKSLEKFVTRYPGTDISAISDFVSILRAASDISSALDALLAQHGLLQGRWWVLVLLMRQDDLTSSPSALAEKAGVTKATMTGFIDGLEREGLVSRFMDTNDRRKFLIRLSVAGQQKLDEVMPVYVQCVTQFMGVLGKPQRNTLIADLAALASRVDLIK